MDMQLKGRTALVLGGSKGLGFGIAQALANEGARVAITSRSEATSVEAASRLGADAVGLACDTSKISDLDALYETAMQRLGAIDILVLNSGGPPAGAAMAFDVDKYRAAFESLFLGPVHLASRILPGMVARGFGRVMTVGSSGMIEPIENLAISNTIRPAVAGWSKTVAREVAHAGVTVNVLIPGRIFTDRVVELDTGNAGRKGQSLEEVQRAAWSRIPVGRYGTTEEFGAAAAFLASQQSAFITGSLLRIDGGQISSMM